MSAPADRAASRTLRQHLETLLSRAEARAAAFDFIETFCNHERRHSALGYKTPEAHARELKTA